MTRLWTIEEDNTLCDYWPRGGINVVSDMLPDRTTTAIQGRVKKLGLHVEPRMVLRKDSRIKGYEGSPFDVAYWLSAAILSERPRVPSVERIVERWNVSRATAYRWRRWAMDRLEQMQARDRMIHRDADYANHVH